jgi:hypothetical protein
VHFLYKIVKTTKAMATFAVLNQANKQHAYYNGKGTVLVRYKGKKCCFLGITRLLFVIILFFCKTNKNE